MKSTPSPVIWVLDDEPIVRQSLRWLLESIDLQVRDFARAQTFLEALEDENPACVLLDIRMPDMSGLEVQQLLQTRMPHLPVIFMTGHGDIAMAVRAMRAGAWNFFEKPFRDQELLESVQGALRWQEEQLEQKQNQQSFLRCLQTLTPREQEVFDALITGKTTKQCAAELGISTKTVDVHRFHLMQKLGVDSIATLIRRALSLGYLKER
ncbi:response regulator transcription factor [Nitrincola tapanii]|uniref:Response regulator transcription factor n=1 Tax=Nitrincola tapanii TaxID=1708751 RepID=A0A5A9W6A1_9GAMM|nr:response regulator [Nitrincola tapanii]KAA0875648.1 response regulator transcription factor [Nitrincola tapanii]